MKGIKLRLYGLLFLILQYLTIEAQSYNFINYNYSNGFPQANADAIIQDQYGYMWFGTQVGAVRFDGQSYFILDEEKGLANNIVIGFEIDSKQNLWIATRSGLSVYNYDTIISYNKQNGLHSEYIFNVWESQDKTIWVSTLNEIAYLEGQKFVQVKIPKGSEKIRALLKYNQDIYLASSNGILLQRNKHIERLNFEGLNDKEINAIAIDKHNQIWIATFNGELYVSKNGKLRLLNKKNDFFSDHISELTIDSKNNLWIGAEADGIIKYDGQNFTHINGSNGLTNISVLDIYEDIENNIWIGGRNGVVMFNPHNPFIHYLDANEDSPSSVFGMVEDSKGKKWFTTYGNGVSKFDGKNFEFIKAENGLGDNRIFSVIEDRKKNLWFSTAGKGIVKYDGNKFTNYNKNNGFEDIRVFKTLEDDQGNIWSCTSGKGVAKYDGKKFTIFDTESGISNNIVMSGSTDDEGSIWFGTFGSGISKYEKGKFIDFSKQYKIPAQHIRSIAKDKRGNMWFGSSSYGVFRIHLLENDTAFCYYIDKNKGLSSNNVYFVYFDDDNLMWVGTEKGVDKVQLDSANKVLKIKNYGINEGFIGGETSINGVMEDKEGNLWFGTVIGATKFVKRIEKENTKAPLTHITNIKLFFENVNWKNEDIKTNKLGIPEALELPYNKNHLTFEYIGINFTNPKVVKYRYILEGLDIDWSPETSKTEAVYSHIPPGEYTFKVAAKNNDGYWNQISTTYKFKINPPYWQTNYFIGGSIVFILLLSWLILRLRINSLQKTKRQLEKKVKARTAELIVHQKEIYDKNIELQQINEELNAQNAEIEAQRDLVTQQKSEIEKIHSQLMDSIYYARRIQRAVLPSESFLQENLNEFFILYKPLQIVSGDFYWASSIDNKIYFAVADCTGHGVPGGFMSMLGIAFLNDIASKSKFVHTHEILIELKTYLINALQTEAKSVEGFRDGMDIALCCYDPTQGTLEYTGANSPIYLITQNYNEEKINNSSNTIIHFESEKEKFIEIKTPKIPLAIYENSASFYTTTIKLDENDIIYLFTDGYADQFGGESNKKLTYSKFRTILFEKHSENMPNQKQYLSKRFMEWKQNTLQVDDVLVMGVKFTKTQMPQ